jgi:tetratricopeptide (TPR) repeat protein
MAVVPMALLIAIELTARMMGWGYPTSYFIESSFAGEPVRVENQNFGRRFFPPGLARSPSPTVLRAKEPGTCRIFLFGESAALGDPRPGYGMGRQLEVLLEERFPGRKFEVQSVAMTAINSHGLLPLARECARLDGDIWLLYMGNNEMQGPFGAGTVFGPRAPGLAWIRASLALKQTRVAQLLEGALWSMRRSGSDPARWEGLKMFMDHWVAPDDPKRAVVHRNFARNLDDIVRVGLGSGAGVVLCTVASNLRDCAPFASLPSWAEAGEPAQEWELLHRSALELGGQGRWPEALATLASSLERAPRQAELRYTMGQWLLRGGRSNQAREQFERARDADALPFRADSNLNGILLEAGVSKSPAADGLRLVDVDRVLSDADQTGIPGRDQFLDHVHLTFSGNYQVARALAREVATLLPPGDPAESTGEWPDEDRVKERLGYTPWNEFALIADLIQRIGDAPFTNQISHFEMVDHWRGIMTEARARMRSGSSERIRAIYASALARRPDDHWLHQNHAEFLELSGLPDVAVTHWRRVTELIPHHFAAYYQVGRLLRAQGDLAGGSEYLDRAVTIRPDSVPVRSERGRLFLDRREPAAALQELDWALDYAPNDVGLHLLRAEALARLDRKPEVLETLQRAVSLRPDHWEARYLLGIELALRGTVQSARFQFEEVIRLRPDHALAHLNLAIALAKLGDVKNARFRFHEVLRLDPGNVRAREYLARLEELENRQAE